MKGRRFVFVYSTLLGFITAIDGKNWVLLVAGSNGYENYRHQADICHAYHTVRNHGVPQENIITMMFDDIANNTQNPFPGNIINQPDGPNLYPGVVIDYRTHDVNPDTFLAALSGNKTRAQQLTNGRSSKVVESGPDDHIFVNFVDHGGPGVLNFPNEVLTANVLMSTLKSMYENKQYKKMVIYVEACYSGSTFEGLLPENLNVFVTTAANPSESSYACFFDKTRIAYLGDLYSVIWMQDSDKENLRTETLSSQFNITQKSTNTSHVSRYGDMSVAKMFVAEFQGNEVSKRHMPPSPRSPLFDAVPAHEVRLQILRRRLEAAGTWRERQRLAQDITDLMERNSAIERLFAGAIERLHQVARLQMDARLQRDAGNVVRFRQPPSVADLLTVRRRITNWDCYTQALQALRHGCPGLRLSQDYQALKHLHVLVNLCEQSEFRHPQIRASLLSSASRQPRLCRSSDRPPSL